MLNSTNWKRDSYNFILIIIDWLIKTIYNELVKTAINIPKLKEIILDMIVRHYSLPNLMMTNKGSF